MSTTATIRWESDEKEILFLKKILREIGETANHMIPAYAFGGNQAACDMADRLFIIKKIVDDIFPENCDTCGRNLPNDLCQLPADIDCNMYSKWIPK